MKNKPKKLMKSTKPTKTKGEPPLRHAYAGRELIHATLESYFSWEPQMWRPDQVREMMEDIQDAMDEMENPNG